MCEWEKNTVVKNWKFGRGNIVTVRLKLINHFVGFIPCQFACNSTFRNPVFRWKSCKGSVWKSVKKSSRVCTQQGLATRSCDWLAVGKSPKEAYVWSMQGSWRVTLARALKDKTSSLARQLTRDSNSRFSPVARPLYLGKIDLSHSKHTPV